VAGGFLVLLSLKHSRRLLLWLLRIGVSELCRTPASIGIAVVLPLWAGGSRQQRAQ
jgi:hypothetical protein